MDGGQIVLACPALRYDQDRLIGCFFTYDVLRATLSRRDLPVEDRRPFYLFVDEQQVIDRAGILAAMLQQCGKFGLRVTGATQSLMSLTDQTRDAWFDEPLVLVTNIDRYEVELTVSGNGCGSRPRLDRRARQAHLDRVVQVHGQRTHRFGCAASRFSDVFADYHVRTAPQQYGKRWSNLRERPRASGRRSPPHRSTGRILPAWPTAVDPTAGPTTPASRTTGHTVRTDQPTRRRRRRRSRRCKTGAPARRQAGCRRPPPPAANCPARQFPLTELPTACRRPSSPHIT